VPSRWAQVVIVVFWLLMTGWLVRRDVLPLLGLGEMNFRQVVGDRAVEEPVQWNLYVNQRRIGAVTTNIAPRQDGGYTLSSRADIAADIFDGRMHEELRPIRVTTEMRINGMGRLERIDVSVRLDGFTNSLSISGVVRQDQLLLRTHGLASDQEWTIPIDPESITLDIFNGLDYLPNLRTGKAWATRVVNPLRGLFPGGLFSADSPFEVVRNEVVGVEPIRLGERWQTCYVVEHRQPGAVGRTWVRTRDGRVLRQEIPLMGLMVTMELDSATRSDVP
jgi:hypothetical protein